MLKKTYQKGFTIVELLIVIVVIAILAALVLNTFAGVQQRARDTERTTDVKAIASQLEVFYADNGYYPAFNQLDNEGWRTEFMPGVDEGAFSPPQVDGSGLVNDESDDVREYGYQVRLENGDPCPNVTVVMDDEAINCQAYILSWLPEQDGEDLQTITSLN